MKNALPKFEKGGNLPKGVHQCTGDEFINRFCRDEYRKAFEKSISDIFDYAIATNAAFLFFGGSFVSSKDKPNDIDCVMVYKNSQYIPPRSERLIIKATKLDIMFCSLEQTDIVHSYIKLLAGNRYGAEVGIVQINLRDKDGEELWYMMQPPSDVFDIVKEGYINRDFIEGYEQNGVLVTIHGLLSTATWNCEIAPIASSQGWIFAPYVYEGNTPDLFYDKSKRAEIVDNFRVWLYELSKRFPYEISIIAHSFGTYIVASYLFNFDVPPVKINCLILTGSILNREFKWSNMKNKVAKVRNEIAPNDEWVKFMPNNLVLRKLGGIDPIFGDSGVHGFSDTPSFLTQPTNHIFSHNNVIKRDVIEKMWMPYLVSNKYALREILYSR